MLPDLSKYVKSHAIYVYICVYICVCIVYVMYIYVCTYVCEGENKIIELKNIFFMYIKYLIYIYRMSHFIFLRRIIRKLRKTKTIFQTKVVWFQRRKKSDLDLTLDQRRILGLFQDQFYFLKWRPLLLLFLVN